MQLEQAFLDYIKSERLFPYKGKCLVAVSAGVDSMVLAALCHAYGFEMGLAHVNFGLRGAESDADQLLAQEFAGELGVAFHTCNVDTATFASENKMGIQEAARHLRYEWFASLMKPKNADGYDYLLTAHHANDNTETVLMNFFKGTGIAGLQGIASKDSKLMSNLVRPLLFADKKQLLAYAESKQLKWREDASNGDSKYLRNFIRHEVMPLIQQQVPALTQNLLGNIQRFKEVNAIYSLFISQCNKELLLERNGEMMIPIRKLQKTIAHHTVLTELLRPYGFSAAQIPDICKLMEGITGKYVDAASFRIFRNRAWLVITARLDASARQFLIEADNSTVEYPGGQLYFQSLPPTAPLSNLSGIAELHATALIYPLVLRKWKQGDYFYPLGMRKKKKLSRFLIDQKQSLSQKEHTWVLCSAERIVWVIGQRIDDRFKVTPQSQNILRITWSTPK